MLLIDEQTLMTVLLKDVTFNTQKSMSWMMQGRLGKRQALLPSGYHTESKRLILSCSDSGKFLRFSGQCHKCGQHGYLATHCKTPQSSGKTSFRKTSDHSSTAFTCFFCGKVGYISQSYPTRNNAISEKHVNLSGQRIETYSR